MFAVPVSRRTQLLVAASLTFAAGALEARPRDDVTVDVRLRELRPTSIAVLPAVAFTDVPQAKRLVEERWSERFSESGHRWRSAAEVRRRGIEDPFLARSLVRAPAEVRRHGHVGPSTAIELCRRLEVQSVLSLRVDRWEVADGGRSMVELTAALVDSGGRTLWTISGVAGEGMARRSSWELTLPTADEESVGFMGPNGLNGWIVPDPLLPNPSQENFHRALDHLLARWESQLPRAPGDPDAPQLARGHSPP